MTTVLFVDDHLELRVVIQAYLEHHGLRVLTAADGATAVAAAREQRPDVVITDHALPRMTGLQLIEALKRDPETERIPVIMLTAVNFGAIGRKARAAGCASFLSKPCPPRRLLDEVAGLVGA